MNTWYTIRNLKETGVTDIYIDNEIGEFGIPARTFLNELRANAGDNIKLHINSPGGSLIDAFAIYDFIKLKGYKLTAYISGIAASAATVVSSAANEVFIGEHSYFFIHNPYYSHAAGPEADLKKMKDDLLDIYHKKTGIDKNQLSAMMDKETLLNAAEALEMGFVDGIAREAKVAALKRREDGLRQLKKLVNRNISSLEISNLDLYGYRNTSGGVINKIITKVGEIDTWIKNSLTGNDAFKLDWIELLTQDKKSLYFLPADPEREEPKEGDIISSVPYKNTLLPDGKYLVEDGTGIQVKQGIINSFIKPINNNMEDTKDLQSKLDELIQQLTTLLQELSAADPSQEGSSPGKTAGKEKELQKKDETIQGLRQELARVKARRVENRPKAGDRDPDSAEAASQKGWNYVSGYLQNHFR
jgi:ATP-dependent protease ClpP protease subunit